MSKMDITNGILLAFWFTISVGKLGGIIGPVSKLGLIVSAVFVAAAIVVGVSSNTRWAMPPRLAWSLVAVLWTAIVTMWVWQAVS